MVNEKQREIDKKRYYTDENGGTYYTRCKKAHKATGQRCVICLEKSTNIHHSRYGNDVIGVSIFPVCSICHTKVCHDLANWIEHKTDKMKSKNTEQFEEYLKMRYLFLQTVYIPSHGGMKYKPTTTTKTPASKPKRKTTVVKKKSTVTNKVGTKKK